jgi:hypothetical protein
MAREKIGDLLYDLVNEVAKSRVRLCEADEFGIVESAYAASLGLDVAIKNGHVPSSPETLRKLRSAKGKLKRELQEWEEEAADELEVDTEPTPKGAPKKKATV